MPLIKTEKQKDNLAKFSYDIAKIILAITVISPIAKTWNLPLLLIYRRLCSDHAIFHIWLHSRRQGGKTMTYYGIAIIILGLLAIAGIIYVQLDKKHLQDKQKWGAMLTPNDTDSH